MPNQQLIDYVNRQLQTGVSKEEIRKSLLEIGWSESDVNDAMNSVKEPAAAPAGASAPPGKQTAGSVVLTTDIFQSKSEPMFEPKKMGGGNEPAPKISTSAFTAPPAAMPIATPVMQTARPALRKKGGLMKILGWTVLVLVLAGAGVEIYLLLGDKTQLTNQLQAAKSGPSADQFTALVKNKNDLQTKLETASSSVQSLTADLNIFIIPAGSAPNATGPITVSGTLHGGNGAQYTLTTKNNVTVFVKNYKDAKVDAALKGLVGNIVFLSGDHVLGSPQITVTSVNGSGL